MDFWDSVAKKMGDKTKEQCKSKYAAWAKKRPNLGTMTNDDKDEGSSSHEEEAEEEE